jgi:NADP-dependent 3-hydroxy acid dehydrogenase YdfG
MSFHDRGHEEKPTMKTARANQVAVITGAASGIGAGLARKASRLGMKVVLADLDAARLATVAAGLPGESLSVPLDVTSLRSMQALADATWDRFGRVDLLFNNAGIMTTGLMWEIDPSLWQRAFDVNVGGVMNGVRAFVPRMIAAGMPAHVVNTASVGGFLPSPLMAAYTATKAAVVALTESLHGELVIAKAPVKVSLLAPGPVKSGIFDDATDGKTGAETRDFVNAVRGVLTQHGLDADGFADRVFAGIDQQRFWIFPQPEAIDELLQRRTDAILARTDPVLPAIGK